MRFGTKRFNPVFMTLGLLDNVFYSTGGFGGYDGTGDDEGGDDTFGGMDDESGQDDEITLDESGDALDNLFKPEEGKEDDEDGDGDSDDDDGNFPTQEEVTEDLKATIESYNVPEELIPEDLDLSDRKQVRTFATAIGRHAVQSALAAMFKPIHVAMNQQQHELRKEIRSSVQGGFSRSKEEEILLEVIPAAASKADRKVIDVLFTQAKVKHKDPRKAAQATRDALKAMGMNPNGRKSATPGKSGKTALDSYAPRLPNLEPARRPNQRNADRLRRPT